MRDVNLSLHNFVLKDFLFSSKHETPCILEISYVCVSSYTILLYAISWWARRRCVGRKYFAEELIRISLPY